MPSLAEAYERRATEVSRRRLLAGAGLFFAGALLLLAGVVAGATPLLVDAGFDWWETREIAGTLAGLGLPAVFVGVVAVLPASRRRRVAAVAGAAVAVFGVVLFRAAYPYDWFTARQAPTGMAMLTVLVYFSGTITTFWTLFAAVATFKRRNDPGGTVTLEFERGGEAHRVEVSAEDADAARSALGGGVGVFGGIDDPEQEADATASDGGAEAEVIQSPETPEESPDGTTETPTAGASDRYCGNCDQFRYVRTERGIEPYCGLHEELMDDMDACEEWEPNS